MSWRSERARAASGTTTFERPSKQSSLPTSSWTTCYRPRPRRSTARLGRRLAELGRVTFDIDRSESGVSEWLDEFFLLEAAGGRVSRGQRSQMIPPTSASSGRWLGIWPRTAVSSAQRRPESVRPKDDRSRWPTCGPASSPTAETSCSARSISSTWLTPTRWSLDASASNPGDQTLDVVGQDHATILLRQPHGFEGLDW